MNKTRTQIKKIIFKLFGAKVYAQAYAKGKIRDIKNGVLDEKEAALLPHFIREDSVVLDIGANYGHYAVDMSRLCSNGHVYAFEPVPFTFDILQKVIKHFNIHHITVQNAAVSDTDQALQMNLPLLDFGAPNTGVAHVVADTGPSQSVTVNSIRLDDINLSAKVDFIKIDVEGHEPEAFNGMEKLLLKDRPVILIEFSHPCLNRSKNNPSEFAKYIREELSYCFTKIADTAKQGPNQTLSLIEEETPSDGYYFLIPDVQLEQYKNLF